MKRFLQFISILIILVNQNLAAQEYSSDASTVGLWHMNETAGSTVADESGNGNSGTYSGGGSSIVTGKTGFGKARYFDGGSYVSIPYHPAYNIAGPFTVEAWLNKSTNVPNGAIQMIVTRRQPDLNDSTNYEIYVDNQSGVEGVGVRYTVGGAPGTNRVARAALDITDGLWHHIAGVFTGTQLKLYVDAHLVSEIAATDIPDTYTYQGGINIGREPNPGYYLDGTVDEVRISNRAREPWEFNYPVVKTLTPSRNALDVSKSSNLSIKFNLPMNTATLTSSNILVYGSLSGKLPGSLTLTGDSIVNFDPLSDFKSGEEITIRLSKNITSAAGDTLAGGQTWSFWSEVSSGANAYAKTATISLLGGVGNGANEAAAADLDNDGDVDLVVNRTGALDIYLNDGIGRFSYASTITTPGGAGGVCVADLDNDGDLDLAAGRNDNLSIVLNEGSAAFPSSTTNVSATKTLVNQPTVGDIDGDGDIDILLNIHDSGGFNVFKNNGSGTFINAGNFDAGANYTYIVPIADIDGDGDLDCFIPDGGNDYLKVIKNDGKGNWSVAQDLLIGDGPNAGSFTDIDGDGDVDIMVSEFNANNVRVLTNDGFGIFSSFSNVSVSSQPSGQHIVDFDSDGDMDVIVNLTGSQETVLLKNTGNGNLSVDSRYTTGNSSWPTAADFDNDGAVEIAVTNQAASELFIFQNPPTITSFTPTSGAVGTSVTITGTNFNTTASNNIVYFGGVKANVTNAASTSLTVTVPTGATYAPITVTDTTTGLTAISSTIFNVTFESSRLITPLTFETTSNLNTQATPYWLAVGDIDGDGKPDLATTNSGSNSVTLYRNTSSVSNLSFAAPFPVSTYFAPIGLILVDFDGDGKLDMATTHNTKDSVKLFRNTSTSGVIDGSTFTSSGGLQAGSNTEGIAAGDLDADGRPDLIISNYSSNTVSVFRNISSKGLVAFASAFTLNTGTNPIDVALEDLDDDGKLDIAIAERGDNNIKVYRKTGSAASLTSSDYGVTSNLTTGTQVYRLAIADIDNDGKRDIVQAYGSSIAVFRNTSAVGSVSFSGIQNYAVNTDPYTVGFGDLDGDGKVDLGVTNYGSNSGTTVSILRNISESGVLTSNSLEAKDDLAVGTGPVGMAIADMDGDGKVDIATANRGNNTISLFRNAIATALPQGEYIADTNTVLLLHFDESSGSATYDASGKGNNGTSTGTTIMTGKFGNALSFNGSSSYVQASQNASLAPLSAVTVEAWVNPVSYNSESTIAKYGEQSSMERGYRLEKNLSGNVEFAVAANGNWVRPQSALSTGKWHHVAGVYDGAFASLYFDGQLVQKLPATGSIQYGSTGLTVGANDVSGLARYFNGLIDEVRISNIARDPSEFNLQLPPKNLSAISAGSGVDLSWQNGGGQVPLEKYYIYRGTDSTTMSKIDSTTSTSKSVTQSAGTYYYRISALDSTGFEGAKSVAVSVVSDLVAFYPFTGGSTADSSGNGNNGMNNGATQTTDRFGNANSAMSFDGSSSYIQVADNSLLDLTGNFTLSVWEYSNQIGPTNSRVILSKHPYGVIDGYWLAVHPTGQLNFQADPFFDNTSPSTDSNRIVAGTWQHIVFTYDKSSQVWAFYVNDILIRTGSKAFTITDISNDLVFGNRPGDPLNVYFDGNLDDILIYNRALSASEIDSLYHVGGWMTMSDYDGNVYGTVQIGTQTWMAENLKVTHYRDGSVIPNVTDNGTWAGLSTGAYSDYNNNASNSETYGRLYNWFAATDARNIAPPGWHVPTDAEWTTLTTYLGGESAAGGKLKEAGTVHWTTPNTGATNETGFTALPGEFRDGNGIFSSNLGVNGDWWSSTANVGNAWSRYLNYNNALALNYSGNKKDGLSLRLVKDGALGDVTPPSSPTNLAATAGNQQVALHWNNNTESDFMHYRIYRGTSANPTTQVDSTSSAVGKNDTTKTFTGLVNGTTYYFRITAVDSAGNVSGYSNEVSDAPFNSAPFIISAIRDTVFNEDFSKTFIQKLSQVFTEPDGQPLTYSASSLRSKVSAVISNDTLYLISITDLNGLDSVIVQADDGTMSVKDTFIIVINSFNDAPSVVRTIRDTSFNEDAGKVFIADLQTIFSDPENEALTYTDSIIFGDKVTISVSNDSLYVTTVKDSGGPEMVYIRATDPSAASVNTSFFLTINRVNDAPFIVRPDTQFTSEDTGVMFSVSNGNGISTYDVDMAGGEIQFSLYTFYGNISLGSISGLNFSIGDGVADIQMSFTGGIYDVNLALEGLVFTPTKDLYGNATMIMVAGDLGQYGLGGDMNTLDSVVFKVAAVNDQPEVVSAIPDTVFDEDFGDVFVANLNTIFGDADNTTLNYTAIGLTSGITPSVSNDSLYLNSVLNFNGNVNVKITASDGPYSIVDTFSVTINAVNDPPTIANALRDTSFNQSQGNVLVSKLSNNFSDVDNALTYTVVSLTPGLTAQTSNDSLYLKNLSSFAGSANVKVTVDDGALSAVDTFGVIIVDNMPPAAPANLSGTPGNLQVSLQWNQNTETDFKLYRIFWGTSANPTAQRDSVTGKANTTKVITNLTNATSYYCRIAAVDTSGNMSAVYSNEIQVTTPTPPRITHSPILSAQNGDPITISATVTGTLPDSVRLFYGKGSDLNPTGSIDMTLTTSYSASIPGSSVTPQGVWYKIKASNMAGDSTYPRNGDRQSVSVRFDPAGISQIQSQSAFDTLVGLPKNNWFAIGLPVNGTLNLPLAFGTASSPTTWAAYKFNYNLQDRDKTLDSVKLIWDSVNTLKGGQAYLIFHKTGAGKNVFKNIASPNTISIDSFDQIILKPGWNFIAWPYGFAAHVWRRTNMQRDSVSRVWELFSSTKWDSTHWFKPFGAYMIENKKGVNLRLSDFITWDKNQTNVMKDNYLWKISFNVESGNIKDAGNDIGVSDEYIISESKPLSFGDDVSLGFEKTTEKGKKLLCEDLRLNDTEGHVWDMMVNSSSGSKQAKLSWTREDFPASDEAVLIDISNNAVIDLKTVSEYSFRPLTENTFKIVAGSPAFVKSESEKIKAELPKEFALSQNYPNPFNPTTTIMFDVARSGNVKIKVYNVLGQEVATLVDGFYETGRNYRALWNGKDALGRQVASGVYIYRLQSGKISKTKKMMLVK